MYKDRSSVDELETRTRPDLSAYTDGPDGGSMLGSL